MDKRIDIKHMPGPFMKFLKWRWYSFLRMQIKVARQLDPVIVVSESTKRDVTRDFKLDPQKMRLVLHGIDHETFRPRPDVKRLPNRLIACASADVPLKGLIYLIRAYAELLKTRPDLELYVIGKLREGPTATELRKLGIIDKVKFITNLTDDDITEQYAKATIAVSPSVYEGFGFPAGEAMACGAPVIATTGGSLPEVVGEAGVIVPHSNPPALAEAIADLLDNPQKRDELGRLARERILREFKWERTGRQVVDVYKEAMANANGGLQYAGS